MSSKDSIENQLATAQIVIDRALGDQNIQTALVAFGYSPGNLQEGKQLRDAALALQNEQRLAAGNRAAGALERTSAQRNTRAEYMRHVAIARLAFQANPSALKKLDITSTRKRSQAGWMLQARQFYANALADAATLATLNEYGLTQAKVFAAQTRIDALDADNATQQQRRERAREATRQRDEALAALARWMRDFRPIARAALKNWPQFLETLSPAPRNERIAARRAVPAASTAQQAS